MRLPLHYLLPAIKGIPVLMYHKVGEGTPDRLNITPDQLKAHFQYLKEKGYRALSLQEFLAVVSGQQAYEAGTFLLTFDDGCRNNYTHAYPVIRSFGFKATFFLIGNTVDGTAAAEEGPDRKMTLEEMRDLDPEVVQLALHSYGHISFSAHTLPEIYDDLQQNVSVMDQSGLPYRKVLAYPYGARPKDAAAKSALKQWMTEQGFEAAFRIGNEPCRIPAQDRMELKRIDVWGTDTVKQLGIKLKKGKLNLF